jgi:4-amino-4-deoxy-L-arabinose transferase-like glycosyltransferase
MARREAVTASWTMAGRTSAALWRSWALLGAICLVLYLPGIAAVPPLDRDEARFAQATRQMLETGDFVQIRFQDEARNKKPVGIHWLQAASVALFSTTAGAAIWPYRLPSLAGALLASCLVYGFWRRSIGERPALLAALLLASSLGVVVEAHLAKTDAALLASVVAAQGALSEIYRRHRLGETVPRGLAVAFWLAQGVGLLLKGPIAPLVSLLTVVALLVADRDAAWLRQLRAQWGVPLAVAVVLPWLVAIELATGGAFLADAVGRDMLGKVAGGQESHGAPPGYYFLLAPVTFWPASLFLVTAGIAGWRGRAQPIERFLLAWILPTWLLFELVPTKLPHYVLPLYPALALLAARGALQGVLPPRRWLVFLMQGVWLAVGLALCGGLIAAPVLFGGGFIWLSLLPALGLLYAWWTAQRDAAAAPRAAFLMIPIAFAIILPSLDSLSISREAATLAAARGFAGQRISAAGYGEPSLVFLLGTGTRLVAADQAAVDIADGTSAAALVNEADDAAFRRALQARGRDAQELGRISGLNYSNGRRVTLLLYRPQ